MNMTETLGHVGLDKERTLQFWKVCYEWTKLDFESEEFYESLEKMDRTEALRLLREREIKIQECYKFLQEFEDEQCFDRYFRRVWNR